MTAAKTYYVTSRLLVGEMPRHLSGILVWVEDAPEAVRVLRAGATAVLPAGAFDLAREVLLQLDNDPAYAEFSIALAQGVWLTDCTGLREPQ